jgi:AcrR family transcriptional regulator
MDDSSSSVTQTRYHHGDLRNALLQAGEQLLVEKGAAALSLREVARSAGVSHTAPYRHFKSKSELLQALAQSGFEQLQQVLEDSAAKAVRDPVQKMIEAGVAYVRLVVRNPEVTRLMFGGMVAVECSDEYAKASDAVMNMLVAVIEEGTKVGAFRDRDPRELAMVAWTSMHGLSMLLLSGSIEIDCNDEAAVEQLVRSLAENVVFGIAR